MNDKTPWEAGPVHNDAEDGQPYINIVEKVPGIPILARVYVQGTGRKSDRVAAARKVSNLIDAAPALLAYLIRLADAGDAAANALVKSRPTSQPTKSKAYERIDTMHPMWKARGRRPGGDPERPSDVRQGPSRALRMVREGQRGRCSDRAAASLA